ncbi:Uncharacterised protein [Achromobacter xylosoxidans]|nr:Uncharacterised protein [Achromobacter xylosoxidans]
MLAAGAAEHGQRVFGDVVAALHRDALDGFGHVADGDFQEAFGQLFRRHVAAGGGADLVGHGLKALHDGVAVQHFVGVGTEHLGEEIGLDLAEQHVAVGHGQRPAAAVAGGAGVGAGRIRADAQARAVEMQDRTAAGRDRVDAHHGRAHAHAGHQGLELALEFAGVVRHVGGGAAHVEADDLVETGLLAGAHHADDAAGRAGQDGVLAAEAVRVGQAAARLHEHQADAGQFAGHLVDVALEDGRQVGVDHGGVAARDVLDQRADLVRGRHLGEADLARDAGGALLVAGGVPGVHEDDGDGADAAVVRRLHVTAQRGLVQVADHFAVGGDALVGLDHGFVEHFRQQHIAVEQARAVLVGNAQAVAETARGHQQRAFALAFEQRVGGDGGAHLDAFDLLGRHRLAGRDAQQLADARHRRVAVLLGIFRQHLRGGGGAVGAARHDVGEGAPTINPELPLHNYPRVQEAAAALPAAACGLRYGALPRVSVYREVAARAAWSYRPDRARSVCASWRLNSRPPPPGASRPAVRHCSRISP